VIADVLSDTATEIPAELEVSGFSEEAKKRVLEVLDSVMNGHGLPHERFLGARNVALKLMPVVRRCSD
jgi:hypothetical protein